MDQQISIAYVRKGNREPPELSMSPFPELLKQVKALNESYCFLVSMILKQNNTIGAKIRISSKSLPSDIKKLQQWFIESSAICWLAIQQVRTSSGCTTSGVDKIAFTSFAKKKREYIKSGWSKTRYSISSKSCKIKKNLPKTYIITEQIKKILLHIVAKENAELCCLLFKKCVVKSLKKTYRGSIVRRVWISKPDSSE